MEKHSDYTHHSLTDAEIALGSAESGTEHIIDWSCAAGIWLCSAALSSIQLGLQTGPSRNVVLERWQDVRWNRKFNQLDMLTHDRSWMVQSDAPRELYYSAALHSAR
jgi:hypothetical protein